MIGSRSWRVTASCVAITLSAAIGCTSSGGRTVSTSGAAGATSQAGTAGTGAGTAGIGAGTAGATGIAGTGAGTAGVGSGTAGTTGVAGGSAGASGAGTAGGGSTGAAGGSPDASTSMDAAAGTGGYDASSPPIDAVGRTQPTCKTPKPSPIPSQKPTNECDYLLQSLDFEDNYSYVAPSIEITGFGTALGLYAINNCSPYCYSKELTIGVDIVGGGDPKQLQGEVIVRFPTTGPELPITAAVGRDSLAWINLDGPTAPPFMITGQLVVETKTGIIPAKEVKQIGYANWLDYQHAEFKYFGIQAPPAGPFATAPVDVTGIGFRIMAPANLPKGMEWHGVVYLDHLQIRKGPENNPPGNYPFGL